MNLREEIRKASGETLDLKTYEADMRHLIDRYIQADEPKIISPFGDMSLLDIIVKSGIADAINTLPNGIKGSKDAVAETIKNNVRKKIIEEHLIDPAYFEVMSKLLAEIIKERKANAISYENYLIKIAELVKKVNEGKSEETPDRINTPALRALYNNLDKNEELAIKIDEAIKKSRPADWRGHQARENVIKNEIYNLLPSQNKILSEVERIFELIKKQREY